MKWITRAALAGTMLAGSAGGVLAASPNDAAPNSPAANSPAPNRSEQAEIAGVQAASATPSAAIAAAEQRAGGHALSFGYESDATTNAYEVTVATASGLQSVRIDPANGSVLGMTPQPADAIAGDGLPAAAFAQAAAAPVPLARAITMAETQAGGRALEANYVQQGGRLSVAVDVAGNGITRSFTVDPASGRVTQVASAENGGQQGRQGQQVQEGRQERDGQQAQEGRQEQHRQSSDSRSDGESGQEAD